MRSRLKTKGRRESGTFMAIPHAVTDSSNWRQCSGTAIKMLCELARQYNGYNNGDLGAAFSMLRPRGWSSPETIFYACRVETLRSDRADQAGWFAQAKPVRVDLAFHRLLRRQAGLRCDEGSVSGLENASDGKVQAPC